MTGSLVLSTLLFGSALPSLVASTAAAAFLLAATATTTVPLWHHALRLGAAAALHLTLRLALHTHLSHNRLVADWGATLLTALLSAVFPLGWLLALLRLAWLALVTVEAAASAELLVGVARAVFVRDLRDWLADADAELSGKSGWLGQRPLVRGAALALLGSVLVAFVRGVWLESHATPLLGAWLFAGVALPALLAVAAAAATRLRVRKALADGFVLSTYVAGVAYFSLAALHRAPLQCDLTLSSLWWRSFWPGASALLVRALPPLVTQLVVGALLFSHALALDVPLARLAPPLLALLALTASGELLHLCSAESADSALWRIASQTIGVTFFYAWRVWGGGADDDTDADDMQPVFDDDDND